LSKKLRMWWWSQRHHSSFWRNDGDPNAPENFGDLIGPFLAEAFTGLRPSFTPSDHPFRPSIHVIVGSVMAVVRPNFKVWGPGIVTRDQVFSSADFRAVRGPITHARILELGYVCPPIFGDPALLLPTVLLPHVEKDFAYGIIPHYVDYEDIVARYGDRPEFNIIDVRRPVREVVYEITRCNRNLSSSLHGIIVSHAYGIPTVWAAFSDKIFGDGVKFFDYFRSVGISTERPINISPSVTALELARLMEREDMLLRVRVDLENLRSRLLEARPF
jgi:pyruvyltransferase